MNRLLLVFIGGAFGSVARYWLSGVVHDRLDTSFPAGTFVVNVIGCFVFGLVFGLSERGGVHPNARLFLLTGICGGFTTFSAFSFETFQLLQQNQIGWALANVGGQVIVSVIVLWIAVALARAI